MLEKISYGNKPTLTFPFTVSKQLISVLTEEESVWKEFNKEIATLSILQRLEELRISIEIKRELEKLENSLN